MRSTFGQLHLQYSEIIDLRAREAFGEMLWNLETRHLSDDFFDALQRKLQAIPLDLPPSEKSRAKVRAVFLNLGEYLKNNRWAVLYFSLFVFSAGFNAQLYILPGIHLAQENQSPEVLYVAGGVIPNLILPIVFGKDFYQWLQNILSPLPGLAKLRSRSYGLYQVVILTSLAITFGALSAAQLAALEITESGISPWIIFLAIMVLIGNTPANAKAGISILTHDSLILRPAFKSFARQMQSLWLSKRAYAALIQKDIFSDYEMEYLKLTRAVLEDGAQRLENFLKNRPNFLEEAYDYQTLRPYYPHFTLADFECLKTLYGKQFFRELRLEDLDLPPGFFQENYQHYQAIIRLLAHMSSDRLFREPPNFIRLLGTASTPLGIISAGGFYSLVYTLLICNFGDAVGFSLGTLSSLDSFYIVSIMCLGTVEKIIKWAWDLGRTFILNRYRGEPHTKPEYSALIPSEIKFYSLLMLVLALLFIAPAIFSFPASVSTTNKNLPLFLMKLFGAPQGFPNNTQDFICNASLRNGTLPYTEITEKLFWPTVIGGALFNSNPMFGVARGVTAFLIFLMHKVFPLSVNSHKFAVLSLKKYVDQTIDYLYEADKDYAIAFFQDTLHSSSNDLPDAPSPAPLEKYWEDFSQPSYPKKSGCASRWFGRFGYFASFFKGRILGGEEYTTCLEGPREADEDQGLLARDLRGSIAPSNDFEL